MLYFYVCDAPETIQRRFAILHCPHCGLYGLSPRPSPREAADYYPLDYEPFRTRGPGRPDCGGDGDVDGRSHVISIYSPPRTESATHSRRFRVVERLHFPAERFYLVESWRRRLDSGLFNNTLQRWSKQLIVAVGVILWPALRLLDFTEHASQIAVAAVPIPSSHIDQLNPHGNSWERRA